METEELQKYSLYELRKYGKQIGVKSPTLLSKDLLIENIKKVEGGVISPYFSKRGRPNKCLQQLERKENVNRVDKEKIKEKIIKLNQEYLEKILELI